MKQSNLPVFFNPIKISFKTRSNLFTSLHHQQPFIIFSAMNLLEFNFPLFLFWEEALKNSKISSFTFQFFFPVKLSAHNFFFVLFTVHTFDDLTSLKFSTKTLPEANTIYEIELFFSDFLFIYSCNIRDRFKDFKNIFFWRSLLGKNQRANTRENPHTV